MEVRLTTNPLACADSSGRTHLVRDLRPYVCTFESCPNSLQLYDNYIDWLNHEFSHYVANMTAAADGSGEKFREIEASEKTISAPSIRDPSTARVCPFCPHKSRHFEDSAQHIAVHLLRIALDVLSPQDRQSPLDALPTGRRPTLADERHAKSLSDDQTQALSKSARRRSSESLTSNTLHASEEDHLSGSQVTIRPHVPKQADHSRDNALCHAPVYGI